MAPRALELEQERAYARELGARLQAEHLLARVRIRDGVGGGARCACTLHVRAAFRERPALGGALETAVLEEESSVDVEDLVADDVEAKMARLDHARVDRADRDLVRVVAAYRDGPAVEIEAVLDERPKRLVSVEAHAVEVGGLALVPRCGRRDVDERGNAIVLGGDEP